MNRATILAVNAGSSSLKFALYPDDASHAGSALLSGVVDGLQPGGQARLQLQRTGDAPASSQALPDGPGDGHARAAMPARQPGHRGPRQRPGGGGAPHRAWR